MSDVSLFSSAVTADRAIVVWLNHAVGASPRFDQLLHFVNGNVLFKGVPYVSALWWLGSNQRTTPESSRDFMFRWIVALVVALILARVLQNWGPMRPRPIADPALSLKAFSLGDQNYFVKLNSFPSDHAVEFCAMSLAIWWRHRLFGILAFAWAVVIILLPRLYFGYHYPSDLLSGALIGLGIMWVFLRFPFPRAAQASIAAADAHAPGISTAVAFFASTQIASNFDEIRQIVSVLQPH